MTDHRPRLVAYLDEAGDAGDKYGQGSSQFLAFGCAVTAISEVDALLKLFNEARAERGHSKTFKKFSSNNDKDNFVLTKLLASKPIRTVMVAADPVCERHEKKSKNTMIPEGLGFGWLG
jgi:hypothetical protein